MTSSAQPAAQVSVSAWAGSYLAAARARPAAFALPPDAGPRQLAPPASRGIGHDRALTDGVTLDRPTDMVPTALTNLVERVTGERDERSGRSLTQLLLGGYQLVQAGLRHAAQGSGVVATGSSVLGKVLPTLGIASGAVQVWRGWNELESPDSPLDVVRSRTARTGVLNILAGALLFVPGIGTALAGAATRVVAAANELDAFSALDAPSRRVEDKGLDVARRVHVLDETPLDPYDRTR